MKKLILLPMTLLLTGLQLNGAFCHITKQLPALRQMGRGMQSTHLSAAIQKACPAGMRLFSSSSRSQGGYSYAGGQQQAVFGVREALLLGSAALASVATYDYWNTPEGKLLQHVQHTIEVYASENNPEENPEIKELLDTLKKGNTRFKKTADGNRWQVMETLEQHPEARPIIIEAIADNITNFITGYGSNLGYQFLGPLRSPVLQILKRFPESRTPIVQALTDSANFVKIADDVHGQGLLHIMHIIENFPESRELIFDTITKNIVILAKEGSNWGWNNCLLGRMLRDYKPSIMEPVAQAIVDNLPQIIDSVHYTEIFNILKKYPAFGPAIVMAAIETRTHFENNRANWDVIEKMHDAMANSSEIMDEAIKYPALAPLIITSIIERMNTLSTKPIECRIIDWGTQHLIQESFVRYPETRASLLQALETCVDVVKENNKEDIQKFLSSMREKYQSTRIQE